MAADADGNIYGAEVGPKDVKKYVRVQGVAAARTIPRTPDGKPDLQGIWQVRSRAAYDLEDHAARYGMPAGRSVVEGDVIPYQPWAAAKKRENFEQRATADPLAQCYLPGVPRIMYMEFPFQIFQTRDHVAMTFEWQQVFRLIYTNGSRPPTPLEFWMGDSRGRWEGDTLTVDVTNHNDRTWFDMAGNFHSDALHVVERYTMLDADTIRYEAAIEDPKVFTRPWKISMPLHRQKDMTRVLEYQCRAEMEEANGDFKPDPRTWYQKHQAAQRPRFAQQVRATAPANATGFLRRMPDGKPDLSGFFQADAGGANWGFEPHSEPFTPGGRGVLVDPPTGGLPYQPWAKSGETEPHPTRARIRRPDGALFCRRCSPLPLRALSVSHRADADVRGDPARAHVVAHRAARRAPAPPDTMRLWQGDSLGHWEGDTLVIQTTNLNGKTWLNEVGDIVSHAETVVERFTPSTLILFGTRRPSTTRSSSRVHGRSRCRSSARRASCSRSRASRTIRTCST